MFENLKRFCDSFLEVIPGFDIVVYHDGKCVFRHMGGYSDLENKIPMNGKERYNIYSCTKMLTCVAALQLWEKGMFSLEDKLSDYMPEFSEMKIKKDEEIREATRPILIKHLFEMSAGFGYNCACTEIKQAFAETNGRCPTRETIKYLAKKPLKFEPGERWQYSLCHDVLAALVEVISGEKFEDYVKKNIFNRVGMPNSTMMLPEDELDTICEQYQCIDGKIVNVGKAITTYKLGSEYASGGAGAISTVDDYIKFLEAVRTGVLLKPETVRLMAIDRLSPSQRETYTQRSTHGYGLGVRAPKEGDIRCDFGWGGAAGAYWAIDLDRKISIYHAQHILAPPNQVMRRYIYPYVISDLFGEEAFTALLPKEIIFGQDKHTF